MVLKNFTKIIQTVPKKFNEIHQSSVIWEKFVQVWTNFGNLTENFRS